MAGIMSAFDIEWESTGFPVASGLNGLKIERVSWSELIWAAVTVGRTRRDVFFPGRYSLSEMLYRVSSMYAFYDLRTGSLRSTRAYRELDPTEKASASYALGMVLAKVYAGKQLKIPWLMHLSRYGARYGAVFATSERPDLIGVDALGQWAVVEAKGRARVTQALITKMASQKAAIATINGATPTWRLGVATRVCRGDYKLFVIDPEGEEDALPLEIELARWLGEYYAPVVDLIEDSDPIERGETVTVRVPTTAVEVGMRLETFELASTLRSMLLQGETSGGEDVALALMESASREANGEAMPDGLMLLAPYGEV